MDESGNHGLTEINKSFPVFLLCGILLSESDYEALRLDMNYIKKTFWGNIAVILHSRDIRKCQKEFVILFDLDLKCKFYEHINNLVATNNYTILASAIRKDLYIQRFGKLSNDVYELSLSFIIERAVFCLDEIIMTDKELEIIIEKRGPKEDKKLEEHFQRLLARGTGYVSAERLKIYKLTIKFKSKKENINGLQLADLIAYPMARHVIEPERSNPALEAFFCKIYTKNGKRYGLKVYP